MQYSAARALCALLLALSVVDARLTIHQRSSPQKTSMLSVGQGADAAEAELGLLNEAAARALQRAEDVLSNVTSSNATTVAAANTSRNATGNATGKGLLADELANLNAIFAHMKKSIAAANKREVDGKKEDEQNIKKYEELVASDEKRLNDTNISGFRRALLVNSTRGDRAELKFWKSHRDNSHATFHANLKLSHGLMTRIKEVTDVYKQAMAGKKIDATKLMRAKQGLPAKKQAALVVATPPAAAEPCAPKPSKGEKPVATAPVKR